MATLRELIIKVSANSQSFQTEIARASRMGQDYYRIMQNGGRQSAVAQRETQRALASVTAQLNETRSAAIGMTGAFAGAFATANLIKLADSYNSLSARVKLATTDANDFSLAQKGLMDISQRTGSAFSDNASLFTRASSSLREWGYGTQDILKLTDALANGLQVSGASAEETSSLIVQLSQALGRGVLRGQDFNSVAQSGQRIMKALADGMGVAQKDLKGMADAGQLTTDKIVPALISQLDKLRAEFNAMPNSVSAASTRVQNAFMEWVGGANQASGATATISGVMDDVARNIDSVATAAGALVAVGLARYLGGMASGAALATTRLIDAARSEVALAEAQVRGTQVSTARARAAVYRAQQALVAARGTDTQTAAEKRLEAAQASLTRNIAARTAAQTALNAVTSVGSRLMSGALGLVGGIPGLVLLGAGAWYTMYQNQEQARRSAQDYAKTIDEVREKTRSMSLPEASDNEAKTRQSLDEQNRLIDAQSSKVKSLKEEIAGYQYVLANPGPTTSSGFMINHLTSVETVTRELEDATAALAVEQERLSQMQAKSESIQSVLEGLENRRIALIRQQAAEQNVAYQSLLRMNGQHTEFNRLLGLGNTLLMARQGLVNAPMRVPQVDLNSQQTAALEKSRRDLELSKLKGEAKERARLAYAADDLGLKDEPQFQTGRQELINNGLVEWRNNQANKPKPKGPKSEAEKTEDVYNRLIKQQKEQIALEGQNTELARVKYQVTQGELTSLDKAKKETLLHNAALIDQQNIAKQLKTYRDGLADSNAAARDRGNIDFLGAGAGDKARDRMKEMADIRTDFLKQQRDLQRDFSRGEISEDLYKQQTEALKTALDERLTIQEDYYKKVNEQQSDWRAGISDSLMNYADQAADLSSMAASATSEILNDTTNSIVNNLNNVRTGAVSFKDGMSNIFTSMGETIIKTLIQIATQALITKAILSMVGGGYGGLFSSILGSVGSAGGSASSGTAIQSAGANFSFNALGGVYNSPSLSAYSGGVYSTPQYFAFAKGAGVFGEAGPEAIMPLTRGADGSLGVRAVGRQSPAVQDAARQIEAQPRIAVSVDARSTFTGQPDDATMLAVERRNDALEQRIINTLTAEINSPQKKFGRAIYSNLQAKKPT